VRAVNPAIKFFETSCFDGTYITGDITPEYLNGVENQRGETKSGDDGEGGQLDLNLVANQDN